MKIVYQVLTVLFWLTVLYAAIILVRMLTHNSLPSGGAAASGQIIGSILGVAVLPSIVYLIRHLVGKNLPK